MPRKTLTGLDILAKRRFAQLKGARVAVLANAASVDRGLRHIVDLVTAVKKVELRRIFSPEHGLRGAAQDMVAVASSTERKTGVPVVSLYGSSAESLSPREEDLSDIDVLVVDLPDVGARYYTYAQTMALAMRVCASTRTKVLVLDRPNPIGGTIEGSTLSEACRSFCGYLAVPQRHGLTLGELALLYHRGFESPENRYPATPCELEVVPMQGWKRSMYFESTGLPWVPPSPNIPTVETAVVYPGMCLFEATSLSEGRGTTKPFEVVGAPFIDGAAWATAVAEEQINLSGAVLRPLSFIPQFHKWKGEVCGGVQLHVTDRKTFQPVRWGVAMVAAARRLHPTEFSWRKDPYEFVGNVPAIDLLYGTPHLRTTLEANRPLGPIVEELDRFEGWFAEVRTPYLLYETP